jgi:hypothetical protein
MSKSKTKQFQEVYCDECRICEGWAREDFDPSFCHARYDNYIEGFVEDTFPRLLLVNVNLGSKGVTEKDLRYAFCDTGVCHIGDKEISHYCSSIDRCVKKFRLQEKDMSKKKHKRKAAKIYSEKQFIEIVCRQCGICPQFTEPKFCYDGVYKHNPKEFMERMFSRLITLRQTFSKQARHISGMTDVEFKTTICRSKTCFPTIEDCDECNRTSDCYDILMNQSCGLYVATGKVEKKTKKEKKKGKSYVPIPYASFFSSSSEDFKKEIQRILYGDKNKKQNTDQEVPGAFTAEIHSGSSNGEPKIPGSSEAGA